MPRGSARGIQTFPSAYLEILAKARNHQQIESIKLPNKKAAKALQIDMNRFRQALRVSGDEEGFEAMRDLIIGIEKWSSEGEEWVVNFTPKGLHRLARELKGEEVVPLDKDGLPDFTPQPLPESGDDLVKRIYGLDKLPGDIKDKDDSK